MIKVKLTIPGALRKINLAQFLDNDENRYKNCIFFVNENIPDPDFWFVIEGPCKDDYKCNIDPNRIYFLTSEASLPSGYYATLQGSKFLDQFHLIYTCHDVYRKNVIYTIPFLPWMINANHGASIHAKNKRDYNYFSSLSELPKSKILSVICSSKTYTDDHAQRLRFVIKMKEHFKDKLDWFGNGIHLLPIKWDGIAPYKYHLVLENHPKYNIITEKIFDAFLGLSYPIYNGAPNILDFFPDEALTRININDFNGSINQIESVLQEDRYNQKLSALIKAKELCLNQYNLFHRIGEICIKEFDGNSASNPKEIELQDIESLSNLTLREKAKVISKNLIKKIGTKIIVSVKMPSN
jgi:hypothetical protein